METSDDVVGAILCAGFGTRLRPLTEALPKPLLPFLNSPIVTYALDHLARAGIDQIGLNLHHLADAIPPLVDQVGAQFGVEPRYAREWEIMGTAGGVRGIWQALGEPAATMVVVNGDSIMNIDLDQHLQAHRDSGKRATLVVRPRADDQPGRVWLDDDQALVGLREMRHPEAGDDLAEYDFTGVHFIEPDLLADIPLEEGCMVGDVYGPLLEAGEALNASINDDFWAALDNPELFLDTTRRVLETPEIFEQAPLPKPADDGGYLFDTAAVDDAADIAETVLLGPDTRVAAGAQVGPNVVIDGARIGEGAVVENAVIYAMDDVEGTWRDCIAVAGQVAHLGA